MTKPKKIAVLGGGLSAMTTVYTLLDDPDWESKYDITVYQLGWRLGGKGASGVNEKIGGRIEEHGLHLWMGFYENAFKMMRKVYDRVDRKPDAPLSDFYKAFSKQHYMVFQEHVKGDWINWEIPFPPLPGKVGDGKSNTVEELMEGIFNYYLDKLKEHFFSNESKNLAGKSLFYKIISFIKKVFDALHNVNDWIDKKLPWLPNPLKWLTTKIKNKLENILFSAVEKMAKKILKKLISKEDHKSGEVTNATKLLSSFRKWLWDEIGDAVQGNNIARRLWDITDFGIAMLTGMINDKVLTFKGDKLVLDFDIINDQDFTGWLIKNGSDPKYTSEYVYVKSMYDGPFAFVNGNVKTPNAEAGTMLRILLRMGFTSKENMIWRMDAGMGDTIFAPIYEELLKAKKIKVKFFQPAREIILSDDKKSIQSIKIGEQVTLKKKDVYEPLINAKDLMCWPSEPRYEFIDDEQVIALKKKDINLESSWADWEDKGSYTLEKGVDFDEVIIGASVDSLPVFAKEIVDNNPKVKNMVNKVKTVQTQAFQFWFNQPPKVLGVDIDKLSSTYVEPLDTFCAMNQLIKRETWPKDNEVKYITYFCGAFPQASIIPPFTDHNFPKTQLERVKNHVEDYIKNDLQHMMPGAFDNNNNFKWDYFHDYEDGKGGRAAKDDRKGKERLDAQYIRVNIDPSEKYVLSVQGSSSQRLTTADTGFDNLYFTGDWIQNGLNAGFVEGAVTSGLLTARAISGDNSIPIIEPDWGEKLPT